MNIPGAGLQLGHLALLLSCVALLVLVAASVHHIRRLRQRLERKADLLKVTQRRFDDALESMAEGFALFDAEQRLVYCNQRYLDCFPRTADLRLPGARLDDLRRAAIEQGEFKDVDASNGDAWIAQQRGLFAKGGRSEYEFADGRCMVAMNRKTPDGGTVVVWHDVTERKRLERELEHRATHDSLTGLPNRVMFRDEFGRARARAERNGTALAVMLVDLDHFKTINDTHGHAIGDHVLVEMARRLGSAVRAGDFVARLAGDEFAILAEWPAGTPETGAMAQRLVDELARPLSLGGLSLRPSASIGLRVYPDDPGSPDLLLANADRALYAAKAAGRGSWASTSDASGSAGIRSDLPGRKLVKAVDRGEFDLDYQPILTIDTLEVVGVEALVRWNHPERGRLSAGEFIRAAERGPAILPLTRFVLARALAQQRIWRDTGVGDLRIWVNLAPRCLAWDGLVDTVAGTLAHSDVAPRQLVLELTESTIASERAAEARLAALRRVGVAIAIDDFGAGHSSLGRLKALPLDVLKIDRAFVAEIVEDERDRAIVQTVAALGANLHLTTTAEGIETADQLRVLRRLGCSLVQGYLFARPMPAAMLGPWLQEWRERRQGSPDPAGERGIVEPIDGRRRAGVRATG
jgi:diguanylate cyclase (GGDEF)-like protein